MKRISVLLVAFVVLVIGALLWLSLTKEEDVILAGRDRVRLQLQWFDQAQFTGFYVAAEKKFFEEEGLLVEIIPGGFNVNPVQRVVMGQADIGIATGDQVLLSRATGQPIKAFGTVFNRSLACFMSRATAPVRSPSELAGKKVAVYRGFDTENILLALLNKHHIPVADVQIVDAGALQAFIQGEIQVFPAYQINEPLIMRAQNIDTVLLSPDDYGVSFYGDTLFTTEGYLRQHRDVATRFIRAAARGWQFARTRPDEAIDMMYRRVRSLSREPTTSQHQRAMLGIALRYLGSGTRSSILAMERSRWNSMEESLVAIGKLNAGGHVDDLCDFDLVEDSSK